MSSVTSRPVSRRTFLHHAAGGAALLALPGTTGRAAARRPTFSVGAGVVDTTPPLGIELAGFHRTAGKERRIAGIRRATAARVLLFQLGEDPAAQAAIVSLDICGVSRDMTARVQKSVAGRLGIPATNVRLCATHTHSMPTLRYFRQWGAISPEYLASVEQKIVQAAERARGDLAEAELYVGQSRAPGASNNRTTKVWKTDEQFAAESNDSERWLDTAVRTLLFDRGAGKSRLLWYHFSAHPVCYRDEQAGPDWPGLVDELIKTRLGITPSFLQGHSGDVNAGDAEHWIGSAENTAQPVAAAIERAVESARQVPVGELRVRTQQLPLPLDMQRFAAWIKTYRTDPAQCRDGVWVDPGFAAEWFRSAEQRDPREVALPVPLSVMQLGEVGFVFHPAELYSCYGLTLQRDSPYPDTLAMGYTDDLIGYLPDPAAYEAGEYSAITVPKILDLPPFQPTAARALTQAAVAMLKQLT